MESSVKDLISLHKDFWNHRLDKPIINNCFSFWRRQTYMENLTDAENPEVTERKVLHDDWSQKDNFIIEPDMLIPERHQTFYEYDEQRSDLIIYPVFNTIIPWTMITWLPAIAGCEIIVSKSGQTIWPKPYMKSNWFQDVNLGVKPNWSWLDKLIEFTGFLVKKYFPSQMISLEYFSRGPADLLLSTMDNETAYISFFDHPEKLKELLMKFADIHIKWSESQLKAIPSFEGGYCNQWGIWAPGKVTRIQEDFAINLSEKLYREFIIHADEKVIKASEYQVFHTHSGNPQLALWASDIEDLKVVEMTLDPVSPSLEELIPVWKKILSRKSMIITGSLIQDQVDMLVSKLDSSGLFLDIVILKN